MRTALAFGFVLLAAAAAHAQKQPLPGQGIDWQGDWDAAIAEASARGVPIMFTVHKDN